MKILVNLVGLSHNNVGNGMHSYKDGYPHLFENVINPLRENNIVDFYLRTYNTEEHTNLLNTYQPIRYESLPDGGTNNSTSTAFDTYITSIENLRNFDYEFFIVSRFDLVIKEKLNIDFSKFNFLFREKLWWGNHNCTTDTFYGFPKEMLEGFISACKDTRSKQGQPGYLGLFHGLHKDLVNYIDSSQYHFIDDELTTVQESKKYTLGRYNSK